MLDCATTVNGWPTVDLTDLQACDDVVIRLPNGLMLHLEYLEGEEAGISCTGYATEYQLIADDKVRLSGFEPTNRAFHEIIPDVVLRADP